MPKGQHLTPYQQAIVRRFYDHRESMAQQKLADLVGELWMADTEKKKERLWARVEKALLVSGGNEAWVKQIIQTRDLKQLALIVGELF